MFGPLFDRFEASVFSARGLWILGKYPGDNRVANFRSQGSKGKIGRSIGHPQQDSEYSAKYADQIMWKEVVFSRCLHEVSARVQAQSAQRQHDRGNRQKVSQVLA